MLITKVDLIKPLARAALVSGLAMVSFTLTSQQVSASGNNSGRYVVAGPDGRWVAIEQDGVDVANSVFYPSWYLGAELSQSQWEADDFESDSMGSGLVIGNHFSPHWRWELRHRLQKPDSDFTGAESEDHSLSSVAFDYLISEPEDGFSPVLRLGVAVIDGDQIPEEHSDPEALAGLGMQWRKDRWAVRLMAEQMGEDQRWAAMTFTGYVGGDSKVDGGQSPNPKIPVVQQPQVQPTKMPEATIVAQTPKQTLDSTPTPVSASCDRVFATRVLKEIEFEGATSAVLSAKSRRLLAQIGASYAKRDYVAVRVDLYFPELSLAIRRADAVEAALNVGAKLQGRIESHPVVGPDSLSLAMKDTRRCK